MKSIKQTSVFLFLLLILIACTGGDGEDANAASQDNKTGSFATLPIFVSEPVLEGGLVLKTQNLKLQGVKNKQGQILAVAGNLNEHALKMGFVSLSPVQGNVAELVFTVTGDNPEVNVISFQGTLPTKERKALTVTLQPLQYSKTDPLEGYDPQVLAQEYLSSMGNLVVQQNDSSKVKLKADFAKYPLGDINQNNQIDFDDALAALKFHYGISTDDPAEYALYHADIDCSGTVGLEDVIDLLLRVYDLKTLSLHACPNNLQLNKGESSLVLIGGPMEEVVTKKSPQDLLVDVKDVSSSEAVGKVYEITAQGEGASGEIEFDAGVVGKEQVGVDIIANTFILEPGKSVATIDGISFSASENAISNNVTVIIEEVSPPLLPLPAGAKLLMGFYDLSGRQEDVTFFEDIELSIPLESGIDPEKVRVAIYADFIFEGSQGKSWQLSPVLYDDVTKTINDNLKQLPEQSGQFIFTLVEVKNSARWYFPSELDNGDSGLNQQQVPSELDNGDSGLNQQQVASTWLSSVIIIDKSNSLSSATVRAYGAEIVKLIPTIRKALFLPFYLQVESDGSGAMSFVVHMDNCTPFSSKYKFHPTKPMTKICALPNTTMTDNIRKVIIHELFHAVQFAYKPFRDQVTSDVYKQVEWFMEGTAALSEAAFHFKDYRLQRRVITNTRLKHVNVSLVDFNERYDTQDFWAFFGLRDRLTFDYLIPFMRSGPFLKDVDQTFSVGLREAYWEWAKNQIYEKRVDIGGKSLGKACTLVEDFSSKDNDSYKGSVITKIYDSALGAQTLHTFNSLDFLTSEFLGINLPANKSQDYAIYLEVENASSDLKVKFYEGGQSDCAADALELNGIPVVVKKGEAGKTYYILVSNTSYSKAISKIDIKAAPIEIHDFTATPSSGTSPLKTTFDWILSTNNGDFENLELSCSIELTSGKGFVKSLPIEDCITETSFSYTFSDAGEYTTELHLFVKGKEGSGADPVDIFSDVIIKVTDEEELTVNVSGNPTEAPICLEGLDYGTPDPSWLGCDYVKDAISYKNLKPGNYTVWFWSINYLGEGKDFPDAYYPKDPVTGAFAKRDKTSGFGILKVPVTVVVGEQKEISVEYGRYTSTLAVSVTGTPPKSETSVCLYEGEGPSPVTNAGCPSPELGYMDELFIEKEGTFYLLYPGEYTVWFNWTSDQNTGHAYAPFKGGFPQVKKEWHRPPISVPVTIQPGEDKTTPPINYKRYTVEVSGSPSGNPSIPHVWLTSPDGHLYIADNLPDRNNYKFSPVWPAPDLLIGAGALSDANSIHTYLAKKPSTGNFPSEAKTEIIYATKDPLNLQPGQDKNVSITYSRYTSNLEVSASGNPEDASFSVVCRGNPCYGHTPISFNGTPNSDTFRGLWPSQWEIYYIPITIIDENGCQKYYEADIDIVDVPPGTTVSSNGSYREVDDTCKYLP